MPHITNPEAEALLDKEFPVLDKGFVRLVDYMGSDERIVASARVSYGKGTKTYREDQGLINYLMRNQHTSPFEQVVLTFHVKTPIFVARQWVRHRTARMNEISGRYSVMKEEFYIPEPDQIRPQSTSNKQGRADEPLPADQAKAIAASLEKHYQQAYEAYQEMLDQGIARELARIVLPLSLYTEWYWQMDLHNLFHFLKLRMDDHAQYEIREYGRVIGDITQKVAPMAWSAFERYVLHGRFLSREELDWTRDHLAGREDMPRLLPRKLGLE
ncbi:MAG: FAD-dependent thymidylate synthase [Acidobacteriota bacterium]|jgi:thymidylate synthase (FAD)